jgi:Uma2 family endonuclease
MATGTLVSVEEYLSTSYRPDREYIDGVILERNLGEYDHSNMQRVLGGYFYVHWRDWKVQALPEQRVQVKLTRYRVPDLCVVLEPGPFDQIFTEPPFICIEILSKEDTVERLQERIDDYLNFGVPYVWVINPRSLRAFVHTAEGNYEAKDGILRTVNPDIVIPLAELFR